MEIDLTNVQTVVEKSTYSAPIFHVTEKGLEKTTDTVVQFVKGNKADPNAFRQEGFTTETLLTVCVKYLQENNVGELSNRDTSIAITHIEDALLRLQKRANDPKKQGVQGTYKPHS